MKRRETLQKICLVLVLVYTQALGPVHAQPAPPTPHSVTWSFDQGWNSGQEKSSDHLLGYARPVPGVKGQALEFDGYTTGVSRDAKDVPELGNAFSISAWVALNSYPWNWVPVVDQSEYQQVGFFFGIDAFGHVGFGASIDGVWQQLTTTQTVGLKKWVHLTAVFNGDSGLVLLIDGAPAASLRAQGTFWQARQTSLIIGRVRSPQVTFPAWISHPQDPIQYSLDGYLDEVQLQDTAISRQQDEATVASTSKPEGDVIPYASLPSGPPGAGPFGALYASLQYSPSWDRLRRLGPDTDVVVRFDKSAMRLVFWQGTNYIPAWVTENGKWYTDEFLETFGPGCGGAGDCEPMSDKQERYSHVSILQSTPARAIVHWRYALAEARNYEGAHPDPLSGWSDWADEYWTVYPDGVAVRKQVLWSSALDAPHEWQETIVINGPGQRPEDNIEADALTLENMAGETATYRWQPKSDRTFSLPKGPTKLDLPRDSNMQVVHLKSAQNPFQVVPPKGVSFDTYNGEPSYSMFEWWNHWPVAQVGSSGRPALAPDRSSHTSLSHIYWDDYTKSPTNRTKLMLCGLTSRDASALLPLAKSWLSPPDAERLFGQGEPITYDPSQRSFIVPASSDKMVAPLEIRFSATAQRPLVNPVLVLEGWNNPGRVQVEINGKRTDVPIRSGIEHHLEGDSTVIFLELTASQSVKVRLEPLKR